MRNFVTLLFAYIFLVGCVGKGESIAYDDGTDKTAYVRITQKPETPLGLEPRSNQHQFASLGNVKIAAIDEAGYLNVYGDIKDPELSFQSHLLSNGEGILSQGLDNVLHFVGGDYRWSLYSREIAADIALVEKTEIIDFEFDESTFYIVTKDNTLLAYKRPINENPVPTVTSNIREIAKDIIVTTQGNIKSLTGALLPPNVSDIVALEHVDDAYFALNKSGQMITWGGDDLSLLRVPANISGSQGIVDFSVTDEFVLLRFSDNSFNASIGLKGDFYFGSRFKKYDFPPDFLKIKEYFISDSGSSFKLEDGRYAVGYFADVSTSDKYNNIDDIRFDKKVYLSTGKLYGVSPSAQVATADITRIEGDYGFTADNTIYPLPLPVVSSVGACILGCSIAPIPQEWVEATIEGGVTENVAQVFTYESLDFIVTASGEVLRYDGVFLNVPDFDFGNQVASVSVGEGYMLALDKSGSLLAWANEMHQSQLVLPSFDEKVTAIASGFCHNVALLESGKIKVWGCNDAGQLNAPENLSDIVAIKAAANFSFAIKADGSFIYWGDPKMQPAADIGLVKDFIVSPQSIIAIKKDGTIRQWGGSTLSSFYYSLAGKEDI